MERVTSACDDGAREVNPLSLVNGATPRSAAAQYVGRGYRPVPIASGAKGPTTPNWQHLEVSGADVPELFFDGPQNIGLILGDNGLSDVLSVIRKRSFLSLSPA